MVKLYIFWTLIYLPPILLNARSNDKGFIHGALIALKNILFVGYRHLWYLYGSAVAVLIIALLIRKRVDLKKSICVTLILYAIALCGESYFELLRPLSNIPVLWNLLKIYAKFFETTRNGLFEGVVFVGIGALFAYKKIIIKNTIAVLGCIISFVLLFCESAIVGYFELARGYAVYIFLFPTIFFLFYITTHANIKVSEKIVWLRKYSTLIYFTHVWFDFPIIWVINKLICISLGIDGFEMHSTAKFFIGLFGAFMISTFILSAEKRDKFKWIKAFH